MINFTVGPVQSNETVCTLGANQVPYFRTEEFSSMMLENEILVRKCAKGDETSRVIFITGSGSAGMEAAIMNTLSAGDKALVINGGSFGTRFVELLQRHHIPYDEIQLKTGCALTEKHLAPYEGKGYTSFLVNRHETSTGVLYDMDIISAFCKRNNLFLIVDCISSFLADPFDMRRSGTDIMITWSQKALACPPGISVLVLSQTALGRIERTKCPCQYFDLKLALLNMERGQTPWTPAVGILRQIHARLREIDSNGGVEAEIIRTASLARYFRTQLDRHSLPFQVSSQSLSNALTPLHPSTQSAHQIFLKLKDEYNIWICPNGGTLRDTVFRVGHLGCLNESDYDQLISAFCDLRHKGFI